MFHIRSLNLFQFLSIKRPHLHPLHDSGMSLIQDNRRTERIAKGKTHSGGTPYVLGQQKKPERHDPTMFVCSSSFPPVDREDVAETSLADNDEEEVAAASADDIHRATRQRLCRIYCR